MLSNYVPVSAEIGVCRSSLENDCCNTKQQRCIYNVCVASDPADIATAEEDVVVVDIEDVLASSGGTQKVTTSGVHDTLGLAGRTRCVEKEKRVFGVHGLGSDVVGVLLDLLVPPQITALSHRHICTSALVHQTVLDARAFAECIVNDLLGADELTTTSALIRGDDDLGVCVDDTVFQRVGGETSKDDRVNSTDTSASKEGNDGLGNHGHVKSNSVALLDTHLLESVGQLADLAQKLAIRDLTTLVDLISLVDDGCLVRVLEGMAINTVVGCVQATLDKPCVVAISEGTAVHSLEISLPREQLAGHATPELVWLLNRLLPELSVVVKAIQMRLLVGVLAARIC